MEDALRFYDAEPGNQNVGRDTSKHHSEREGYNFPRKTRVTGCR